MKEKEKLIIEAAIKLFASKGFASTSINEIVTESGISKGAFYLYFKSKDALLLAIFEYYSNQLKNKVFSYENEELDPKEKFTLQIENMLETLLMHKEFMIMQSREQAIPLNESIKEQIYKLHLSLHAFYQRGLLNIYGDKIQPFIWDLSLIFEGMLHSYMKVLLFDTEIVKLKEMIEFILRRMDHIVLGLIDENPVLSEKKMQFLLTKTQHYFETDVHELLMKMKNIISEMEDKEDLQVSFDVLQAEILREKPRVPVIQGMLSNFKEIPQLRSIQEKIAAQYYKK